MGDGDLFEDPSVRPSGELCNLRAPSVRPSGDLFETGAPSVRPSADASFITKRDRLRDFSLRLVVLDVFNVGESGLEADIFFLGCLLFLLMSFLMECDFLFSSMTQRSGYSQIVLVLGRLGQLCCTCLVIRLLPSFLGLYFVGFF